MARTGDHAVRKNGDGKLFEIVGQAIVAAIEESAGLRSALQHESTARADAESELLGFARAIDNFESIVVQAGVHLDVMDRFLHGQHFAQICDRFEGLERIFADAGYQGSKMAKAVARAGRLRSSTALIFTASSSYRSDGSSNGALPGSAETAA